MAGGNFWTEEELGILKKEQASLVLQFVRCYMARPVYCGMTSEMVEIYNKVKGLNRRGN